jgi:hypothetical protein
MFILPIKMDSTGIIDNENDADVMETQLPNINKSFNGSTSDNNKSFNGSTSDNNKSFDGSTFGNKSPNTDLNEVFGRMTDNSTESDVMRILLECNIPQFAANIIEGIGLCYVLPYCLL